MKSYALLTDFLTVTTLTLLGQNRVDALIILFLLLRLYFYHKVFIPKQYTRLNINKVFLNFFSISILQCPGKTLHSSLIPSIRKTFNSSDVGMCLELQELQLGSGCQQHSNNRNSMMYDSDLGFICNIHELRKKCCREFQEYISNHYIIGVTKNVRLWTLYIGSHFSIGIPYRNFYV